VGWRAPGAISRLRYIGGEAAVGEAAVGEAVSKLCK
jgi:hypothetical protein